MNKVEKFFAAFEELAAAGQDETLPLLEQGYDVSDITSKGSQFIQAIKTKAQIRLQLHSMSIREKEAIEQIALALKLDSGPDYRNCCQQAFMHMLRLNGFHHEDPKMVLNLLNPHTYED